MTEITCYECNQPVGEPLYDSKGFAYCADCFVREEDTTEHIGYWYTPKGDQRYEAPPETKEEVDAFLVEHGYDLDQLDKNADALVWKALREVTAERDALKAQLPPDATKLAEVYKHLDSGHKIYAIKAYRAIIGCGLKEAMDAIEVMSITGRAPRNLWDELKSAQAENARVKGYAAFCYGCAKCGEQPMTYEEYLATLEVTDNGA